jgi:hypothetical protein
MNTSLHRASFPVIYTYLPYIHRYQRPLATLGDADQRCNSVFGGLNTQIAFILTHNGLQKSNWRSELI